MVRPGIAGSGNGLMVSPHHRQLLPLIPQKWKRRTYPIVSSVIASCRTATRSDDHFHHLARVNSSETVVLIKHFPSEGVEVIAAYFMKDNIFRELPPIPPLSRGIPSGAGCVSLDGGKVYVLGGHMEHERERIVWRDVQASLCFPEDRVDLRFRTQLYINPIHVSMDVEELIPTNNRAIF